MKITTKDIDRLLLDLRIENAAIQYKIKHIDEKGYSETGRQAILSILNKGLIGNNTKIVMIMEFRDSKTIKEK